jgi:hypothetical protein
MTGEIDDKEHHPLDGVHADVVDLIQRGQAGDREALPTLRALLDTHPRLWTEAQSLTTQVERSWLQVLTGHDLVIHEMFGRQLQLLKHALGGEEVTPLERLLIETLCTHWLQLQDAQLRTAAHQKRYGHVTPEQERRLINANKLLESTAKTLAQVQKLLRPKAHVVNIAQQQIVHIA